jgi:CHASE3 domain sensor protein
MTIGRKLYLGFGAILMVMLVLYAVSSMTIVREHGARANVASTLSDVQTLESVRFLMMENRLFLRNYLLSGDLRDEDR